MLGRARAGCSGLAASTAPPRSVRCCAETEGRISSDARVTILQIVSRNSCLANEIRQSPRDEMDSKMGDGVGRCGMQVLGAGGDAFVLNVCDDDLSVWRSAGGALVQCGGRGAEARGGSCYRGA